MIVLAILLKATVLLAGAHVAVRLSRDARASVRHLFLAVTFAALLSLPVMTAALPPVDIPVPIAQTSPMLETIAARPNTLVPTTAADGVTVAPANAARTVPSAASLLRGIWALGFAVSLAQFIATSIWLRRVRRSGLPWIDAHTLVDHLAAAAGINRPIDVLVHEEVLVPMTAGWMRPTIMLPLDARDWPKLARRNALIHELEHVRRADWLVRMVGRAACALYWFHPLVWTAWRRMTLDAERACDDAVLQRADRVSYATQLVTLAERLVNGAPPHPGLSMANRSDLTVRVSAILDDSQARGRAGRLSGIAIPVTAFLIVLLISPLRAVAPSPRPMSARPLQAPTPAVAGGSPAFDVISIKKNPDIGGPRSFPVPVGGRVRLTNQTVRQLINSSYRIQDYQIVGGAEWTRTQGFDIEAIVESTPAPPPPQMLLRIQTLLADRFKLVMHAETREIPIFRLVKARADGQVGPNIRPSACTPPNPNAPGGGGPSPGGPSVCGNWGGAGLMMVGGNTMNGLANQLGRLAVIGRPVVNETNMTGNFDWELKWTPDPSPGSSASPDALSIFAALQEQLGLKLEAGRGPVDVFVIDSVDRPTEN